MMNNSKIYQQLLLATIAMMLSVSSFSQINYDSLLGVWNDHSQEDTNRIQAMQIFAEQYLQSRPDSAYFYYKQASLISHKLGGKWIADIYQRIGATYINRGNIDSTMYYWRAGLEVSEEINYEGGMKVGYNMVGLANERLGNYDLAIEYYDKSYELAVMQKDTTSSVNAKMNLGNVYQKSGDLQKAIEILESTYEIALVFGHEPTIGKISNILAWVYQQSNRFQEALTLYNSALSIFEKSNDKYNQAEVYVSQAGIYDGIKDYEKAISLYQKSYKLFEDIGSVYGLANCQLNICASYISTKQFQLALESSTAAKDIFEKINSKDGVTAALNSIGETHINLENYALALENFLEAKKFQDNIGKGGNTAVLYANIGIAYLNLGEPLKAIEYANIALTMAKEEKDLNRESRAYNLLYEAYGELKDFKSAYNFLKLYYTTNDSITISQNQNEVLRKEYEYEYEKAALADSLGKAEEALKIELAHQEEISAKNQTRNILIAGGLLFLVIAGGAWRRSQFIKKANEQLAIEKRKAEESEAFKQSFLANMSHEIRTPMNAILGMTNLTLDTKLTAKQKNYLEAVKQSSESLLVIINDVLDISKLESGGLLLEAIPFQLNEVVKQVQTTLQFKAEEKGLALIIEVDGTLPEYLIGDPNRLRQILLNLCGNAIKFTDKGGVKLKVKNTSSGVQFAIVDTGVGIAKDKQNKLFEAFKQADASTTRKYGGTGLGLSISKNFVELMGGELILDSEIGKGSEFAFTLALKEASSEQIAELDSKSVFDNTQLKGLKVLLAEDNKFNQIVVVDTILNMVEEAVVDVANNGNEALKMHQENQYDIILMDSDMPEMDGRQATQKIRKLNSSKNKIPIIALTASVLPMEIDKCLDAGMDDYIPKPFEREEFFITIGKYYKV